VLLQQSATIRPNPQKSPTTVSAAPVRGKLTIDPAGTFSVSERNAAQHMADLGNNVTLRAPTGTRAAGGTSDLLVNGVRYDVYTPTSINPSRIIGAIAKKSSQVQGGGVVLDLSQTTVTRAQLGDVLKRVQGAGASGVKDIVIIGGN
jgi:filamentous hemagglutinin